jgi:hypothetical protein
MYTKMRVGLREACQPHACPRSNRGLDVAAAVFCACGAVFVYRVALYSHAQFGELFKSVFDQHRSLLNLDEVVVLVAKLTGDLRLPSRIFLARNIAAGASYVGTGSACLTRL